MDDTSFGLLMVVGGAGAACLLQFAVTQVGGLSPNRLVGIKTRATLASPEAWSQGHRAAQPHLLAAGITGVAAIAATIAVAETILAARTIAGVSVVVVLALLGWAGYTADQVARRVEATGS